MPLAPQLPPSKPCRPRAAARIHDLNIYTAGARGKGGGGIGQAGLPPAGRHALSHINIAMIKKKLGDYVTCRFKDMDLCGQGARD